MFELVQVALCALIAPSNTFLFTYGAFTPGGETSRPNKNGAYSYVSQTAQKPQRKDAMYIKSAVAETLLEYSSPLYSPVYSFFNPEEFEKSFLEGHSVLLPPNQKSRRRRNAVIRPSRRWPDGIVPYEIDEKFSEYQRHCIREIFEKFHRSTCLRFVPRTTQADYISIEGEGTLSWSLVGRVGGKQVVNLPPLYLESDGVPIHELMHSLGFWHEQNRPDRDNYIAVQMNNIKPYYIPNFRRNKATDTFQLPYDFDSVMHYSEHAFSKNGGSTILPLGRFRDKAKHVGQRKGFSRLDIQKLNRMYCMEQRRSEVVGKPFDTNTTQEHALPNIIEKSDD